MERPSVHFNFSLAQFREVLLKKTVDFSNHLLLDQINYYNFSSLKGIQITKARHWFGLQFRFNPQFGTSCTEKP